MELDAVGALYIIDAHIMRSKCKQYCFDTCLSGGKFISLNKYYLNIMPA